jgi:hypothetical protein
VQRAQQGAARALFPILSPILFPIFGKANSRDFPPKKILTIQKPTQNRSSPFNPPKVC